MKKIYLLISSVFCLGLTACFDLNQEPQGELAMDDAFHTTDEIRTYLNMFYQGSVPVSGGGTVNNTAIKTQSSGSNNGIAFGDTNSDNLYPDAFNTRLAGNLTLGSASDLDDYKAIRNVNFLLQNIDNCEDKGTEYEQCLGEAYYFRAAYYYHLLINYGGVTWVSQPLDPDAGQMKLPRDSRTAIADSILLDLDRAITNLSLENNNSSGRVHKDVARALKSEVALFAATWEKYHRLEGDEFYDQSLTNADAKITDWLEQARDAAKEVIVRSVWEIYKDDPLTCYRDMFIDTDLSGNQEVLWWKQYNATAGIGHNVTYYACQGGGQVGVSASLVDDYLTKDGRPFIGTEKENAKNTYGAELDPNLRDPRLSQTVFTPGHQMMYDENPDNIRNFDWPPISTTGRHRNTTGYSLLKYEEFNTTNTAAYTTESRSEAPAIQVRYADILLNYAEALAELDGAANASEIIKALHPLRDRVDMPDVDFDREYNTEADYPFRNLDKYIQAVRRERRVEKAMENCRLTDILRWAAADELIVGKYPVGAKYTGTDLETHFKDEITIDENLWLNAEGYILSCDPSDYSNGWNFDVHRDYLLPIRQAMVGELTGNLWEQNPGW